MSDEALFGGTAIMKNIYNTMKFFRNKYSAFIALSFPLLMNIIVEIFAKRKLLVLALSMGEFTISSLASKILFLELCHILYNILCNIAVMLVSILLFCLIGGNRMLSIGYVICYILIISVPSLLNFINFMLFNTAIDVSSIGVILNSDVAESIGFIKERINAKIIIVLLSYAIFAIEPLFVKYEKPVPHKKQYCIITVIIFVITLSVMESPVKTIYGAIILQLAELKKISAMTVHKPLKGTISRIYERKQIYVVVIGESVDRKHMSIYGYERKTTPHFNNLKNELYMFKNVRSAFTYTSESVKNALRIRDKDCENIIHFFIDAGFKVFWFSNQGKFHFFDNQVEEIAKLSHIYKHAYTDLSNYSNAFDEKLLDYLEKALNDKTSDKKVIFLHLIGSHFPLTARYPPEFDVFKLPVSYNHKWKAEAIRLFDNSILYTDHVLNSAIEMLRKRNCCAWLLYFSDHGQDIYDTDESKIYRVISNGSPHLYEIPFVVWVSEKYRRLNKDFIPNWDLEKEYTIDKLAYSIADLAGLDHPVIVKE
ncbi:MAG: phosphoethanolamine transferase, partial [Holosporaceae bacterium]|nr:phosphoethanolamine transferase [Holosporaceae bacterium]